MWAGIPPLQLCMHDHQVLSSLEKLEIRKEKKQETTTTGECADLPQASSEAGGRLFSLKGWCPPCPASKNHVNIQG